MNIELKKEEFFLSTYSSDQNEIEWTRDLQPYPMPIITNDN